MTTKRVLRIVLVASAVMLAVGIGPQLGGTARALPPAQASGVTVPYPGNLADAAGQPVADGTYDFTFALYDAPEGGTLLWSETQTGVAVQGGAFTAALGSVSPLPDAAKERGLWLAVSVRGLGEAGFTALTPRQAWSAAASLAPASPSNGPACAHDHLGENWVGAGYPGLRVEDTGIDGTGIEGTADSGLYAWGVYGHSTDGIAVLGISNSGTGVAGFTSAVTATGVVAVNGIVTGTALSIDNGAFRVKGAGVGTNTTVFIHQAHTGGATPNTCLGGWATVINHPLTNGDPNAILIVTINGGTLGGGVGPTTGLLSVQYDLNNVCGFGQRWVIWNNGSAIQDLTKFNVMVVKP